MPELLTIIPTRGRPWNIERVIRAWDKTDAWADAAMLLVVDEDDPAVDAYRALAQTEPCYLMPVACWMPMVPKLNAAALSSAAAFPYLGFAGDDHVPVTKRWARRYVEALSAGGPRIVYGDDMLQGRHLATQWAMTSDIVRALGRMVPAEVEHLYCDNAIMDLGREAGCLEFLESVVIQHRHPLAGTADWDGQYRRVNLPAQYERDRARYDEWRAGRLAADVAMVKNLINSVH